VKDELDVLERLIQQRFIRDAAFNEIDVATDLVEILAMTSRQVVENPNTRAAGD
jgi:hypothetical protein